MLSWIRKALSTNTPPPTSPIELSNFKAEPLDTTDYDFVTHDEFKSTECKETDTQDLFDEESYASIDALEIQDEFKIIQQRKIAEPAVRPHYPETENQWPIPPALNKWWWKYDKCPSEFSNFNGYYFNTPSLPQILVGVGAVTMASPSIFFATTVPMTSGTFSLAFLASQSPIAIASGVACGAAATYVHITLLYETIPLAIQTSREFFKDFFRHPVRNTGISLAALTGTGGHTFLTYQAFAWANAGFRLYMTGANFLGFLVLRGYGLSNAAKRYDRDFAPLSRADKINAVFNLKNLLALPPTIASALIFGGKCDEALCSITNGRWGTLSLGPRAIGNIACAIANPILYFGQIQQLPPTLHDAYTHQKQLYTQQEPGGINTCKTILGPSANFTANALASLAGLKIADGVITHPEFFLAEVLPRFAQQGLKYAFTIGVWLVNGKLFAAALYPSTTHLVKKNHPKTPNHSLYDSNPNPDALLAEIRDIGHHTNNPNLFFAQSPKNKKDSHKLSTSPAHLVLLHP